MRALLAHVRPHRRTLVAAALLGLLGAAAGLAQPLAAREVIEALAADEPLTRALVILSALVVAAAVVTAFHFWLLERTAQRIVLRARHVLTGRVLRLRMGELDRLAPGDLVARTTSDTTLLGEVSSTGLVQLFNGGIALVAASSMRSTRPRCGPRWPTPPPSAPWSPSRTGSRPWWPPTASS